MFVEPIKCSSESVQANQLVISQKLKEDLKGKLHFKICNHIINIDG